MSPAFPSPRLVMPCIPHVCLVAFIVICTLSIVPTSLRCIFAHPTLSWPVFCMCKKMLRVSQWWYHFLKLFSILLKVTVTAKLLLSPEKPAGAAWDVAETQLLQMASAVLETFHSPHSIASSFLQSSGLAWRGIKLLVFLNREITCSEIWIFNAFSHGLICFQVVVWTTEIFQTNLNADTDMWQWPLAASHDCPHGKLDLV